MPATQVRTKQVANGGLGLPVSKGALVTRPNNLAHINRDSGYRWRETDPELERIRNAITRTGWELSFISERSGVSVSTLRSWMNGKTAMPLHATMTAVYGSIGYEFVTVKLRANRKQR